MKILLFASTLSQNGRSDHEFTVGRRTAFHFSIIMQKRERKKKISLYNVVLGAEHFLEVYMGAILLYGSLAETLKHECSEGENINRSIVMRFHCT